MSDVDKQQRDSKIDQLAAPQASQPGICFIIPQRWNILTPAALGEDLLQQFRSESWRTLKNDSGDAVLSAKSARSSPCNEPNIDPF